MTEMTYITPAYPPEAIREMRAWSAGAVFARPLPQAEDETGVSKRLGVVHCKNCCGAGEVFMTYCEGGPHKYNPSQRQAATWFDGDGIYGKGWYKIERTIGYTCPRCRGTGEA